MASTSAPFAIGTTRNLTAQFKRLRDEAKRTRPSGEDMATAALINSALGGGGKDVEMAGSALFAPVWVQKSEKIRVELGVLKDRLSKLKEMHTKVLLVTFDSDDSAQSHVEAITRELQNGFKRLDKEIRGMEQTPGADDAEVRQQVQRQLARALMGLTMEFRKEETRFLNKVEAQKGLAAGSSMGMIETESNANLESMDPGFTQGQIAAVEISTALAEERSREIQNIVNTIVELAQIMRDLGALVVDQGTILDRIDHNIQESAVKIEDGLKQIKSAEKTQKASRMFLCIIALVVLIVVMLIIVVARNALR